MSASTSVVHQSTLKLPFLPSATLSRCPTRGAPVPCFSSQKQLQQKNFSHISIMFNSSSHSEQPKVPQNRLQVGLAIPKQLLYLNRSLLTNRHFQPSRFQPKASGKPSVNLARKATIRPSSHQSPSSSACFFGLPCS